MDNQEWHPIETMPSNEIVIVYSGFSGFHLREKIDDGSYYDDNSIIDDSGEEWEYWTELPNRPKED